MEELSDTSSEEERELVRYESGTETEEEEIPESVSKILEKWPSPRVISELRTKAQKVYDLVCMDRKDLINAYADTIMSATKDDWPIPDQDDWEKSFDFLLDEILDHLCICQKRFEEEEELTSLSCRDLIDIPHRAARERGLSPKGAIIEVISLFNTNTIRAMAYNLMSRTLQVSIHDLQYSKKSQIDIQKILKRHGIDLDYSIYLPRIWEKRDRSGSSELLVYYRSGGLKSIGKQITLLRSSEIKAYETCLKRNRERGEIPQKRLDDCIQDDLSRKEREAVSRVTEVALEGERDTEGEL